MSAYIRWELFLFCQSVLMGGALLLLYQILLALRKVLPHRQAAAAAEDILYWVAAALFLFVGFYRSNGGMPGGFALLGVFFGGFLVENSLAPLFLWIMEKILGFPVEIIKKIIKRLLFLVTRCKISMNHSVLLRKKTTLNRKRKLKRGMELEKNRKKGREKENTV